MTSSSVVAAATITIHKCIVVRSISNENALSTYKSLKKLRLSRIGGNSCTRLFT